MDPHAWSEASDFTSLGLSFLFCVMGEILTSFFFPRNLRGLMDILQMFMFRIYLLNGWMGRCRCWCSRAKGGPGRGKGHSGMQEPDYLPISERQSSNLRNFVSQLFHKLNYITLKTEVYNTQNPSLSKYFYYILLLSMLLRWFTFFCITYYNGCLLKISHGSIYTKEMDKHYRSWLRYQSAQGASC